MELKHKVFFTLAYATLFIGSNLIALSLTQEGYETMTQNVTCHTVTFRNDTPHAIVANNITIQSGETKQILEQCLNEYEKLSRSLGHMMADPIKFNVTHAKRSHTITLPATLERNHVFVAIPGKHGFGVAEDYSSVTATTAHEQMLVGKPEIE